MPADDPNSPLPTPANYQRTTGGNFRWQPPSVERLQELLCSYEIIDMIGVGGMGAVYKARQVSLDRLVAIKVMPPEATEGDASFVERFRNEARLMAKMNHPAIVGVYDFGECCEGQLYIVMEFIDGTDVAKMILAQGMLPPEYALAITAHLCDALQYAHSHGVIHRDIKPANILIDREGRVKVADFGLAKTANQETGFTQANMAMGTPDFVAPEVLSPGMVVDGRADLYAVGVMLYNMLTGEVPRGMFRLPGQRLGTDPRFDKIITRAMEMDRENRYQTAFEIRRDLDQILTMPRVQAGGQSSAAIPRQALAHGPYAPQRGLANAEANGERLPTGAIGEPGIRRRTSSKFGPIIASAATVALPIGAFLFWTNPGNEGSPGSAADFSTQPPPHHAPSGDPAERGEVSVAAKPVPLPIPPHAAESASISPGAVASGPASPSMAGSPQGSAPRDQSQTPALAAPSTAPPSGREGASSTPANAKVAAVPNSTVQRSGEIKPASGSGAISEIDKRLGEIEAQFQAAYDREIGKVHQALVADLTIKYAAALQRAAAAATHAGLLDDVLQLKGESQRLADKQPMPDTDPDTLAISLKGLRTTYRIALAKLEADSLVKAKPFYDRYDQLLEAYQKELTQQQKLDEALKVKAKRDELTAARSQLTTASAAGSSPTGGPVAMAESPLPLFDGRSLDGWRVTGPPRTFEIEDGAIKATGKRGSLFYVGKGSTSPVYKNFDLSLKAKTDPGANSGVFLHVPAEAMDSLDLAVALEIQIDNTTPVRRTGSVYGIEAVDKEYAKDGEWFDLRIVVQDREVTVYIDGKKVNHWRQPTNWEPPANVPRARLGSGTIGLQSNGGVTWIKDIELKPL